MASTDKKHEVTQPKDENADNIDLIRCLLDHLDYCGWGDRWEREVSEPLRKRADEWLEKNRDENQRRC